MSWHYQIRRRIDRRSKEAYYDIVEVYRIGKPPKISWTINGVGPSGASVRDVINALQMMLNDALEYPVLKEDLDHEAQSRSLHSDLSTPSQQRRKGIESRTGGNAPGQPPHSPEGEEGTDQC